MPRGPRNRIAKVFILEGRTGSGPEREEEAKSFAATAPFVPFVLSSFQFNVKGRREREWLLSFAKFFFTNVVTESEILIGAISAICGFSCEGEIAL